MVGDRAGLLVAVLLVAVATGHAAGGSATVETHALGGVEPMDPGAGAPALVALQSVPEADNTITRIAVQENGSATWQLRIRTRLETDEQVREYRAFQERFRSNTSRYLGEFRASISGVVENAGEVTGREMRAEGFEASTSIQSVPRRWGVVTYEFRWVGFARTDGDRILVGDVFEGGLFIAADDALEVVGPPGYRIESAAPRPDESGDGAVSWQGREDFADRRPRVVFAPEGSPDGSASVPSSPSPLVGGVLLLLLAGLAFVGYRRWGGRSGNDGASVAADDAGGGSDGEPTLADEDHVRRLLADHDGRVRQTEIAEALDWSRSKTSRVLARMEEAGAIEKLRLGRENVIALADDADG